MVDIVPHSAFRRDILGGVGKFCIEHPFIRLIHISVEWELTGNKDKIDGVIAVYPNYDKGAPETRFGCPVVNVSCVSDVIPYPTVTIDNQAVGMMAADHLINQGYTHFACHIDRRVYFSRQRADGFQKKLRELQKECTFLDTGADDCKRQTPDGLRRMTTEWLRSLQKPVGLYTHTDTRAATLIEICQDAEIAVPEQVGVIGTDNDSTMLMTLRPTLTSVDPASDVIGYRAAELLLDIVEGGRPPSRPILIPPRSIVQRQSTELSFVDDDMLSMAVTFIRENATKPIGVSDVLENVPISRRSLERRFRERLGRSPADEIRRVQMECAKRLLLENEEKPATVARLVGYKRFRNFATAFRREVGMTPLQYARNFLAR